MSKPENPFPGYKHLLIEPYTPSIGAVVHDFDLADIKDSDARAELRKALAEFQVLFFRKQKLSPAEQVAVARVFGDPDKAKAFFPRHEAQKFIEVLEAIIDTMRQQNTYERKLRAMTAEGRASSRMLGGLPIVFLLLSYAADPNYVSMLFKDPIGNVLFAIALTLYLLGMFWIRRLVNPAR